METLKGSTAILQEERSVTATTFTASSMVADAAVVNAPERAVVRDITYELAPTIAGHNNIETVAPSRLDDLIVEKDHRYGYRFVKRLFDTVFSLFVAVILLVPCLALCLVIRIDSPGSPIYKQVRVGRYGKSIRIIKFRTMVSDSEDLEKYFTPEQIREWETERKVIDDPRITRVGNILRKTSMDELPQFLNVLKGEMSVIGPRPITSDEVLYFGGDAKKLLCVKPGITGWWQVEARNQACFEDGTRQAIEMHYVKHQSLNLDAMIFFKTFRTIINKTGR